MHCKLSFIDGMVIINDLKSKFGTIISMSGDLNLNECNGKATLQKNNNIYNFEIV